MEKLRRSIVNIGALFVVGALVFVPSRSEAALAWCTGTLGTVFATVYNDIMVQQSAAHSSNVLKVMAAGTVYGGSTVTEVQRDRIFSALMSAHLAGRTVQLEFYSPTAITCGSIPTTAVITYVRVDP